MQIGVLSDTHNNQENLRRALAIFQSQQVSTLIHCGDLTTSQTAGLLTGFKIIHVTGNMARNHGAIRQTLLNLNPDNFSGPNYSGQIDGIEVAVTHGHIPGKLGAFIRDDRYAFIFHGHTHRRRDERIGQTRIINPGALGGTRYEERSICFVDLANDVVRFMEIPD